MKSTRSVCSGMDVQHMLIYGALVAFHAASASISCQFATGFCGWTPQYPADIWQLTENVIDSLGVSTEASQLYAGASGVASARSRYTNRRMSAKLLSEEISVVTRTTLSFWIRLSQSDTTVNLNYGAGTAGYLRAVLSNGSSVLLWSKTHSAYEPSAAQISVQLEPRESFRLEFELLVNRHSSELMALTLASEGGLDYFLACTFGSGMCDWSSEGDDWAVGSAGSWSGSFGAPAISADKFYLLAQNPKLSTTARTAVLRSSVLHLTGPVEFSFFYRCKHPRDYGPYAELTISVEYPQRNVVTAREYPWEHTFTVLYPGDNIQVSIIATLPPDSHCAIDQLAWTIIKNEHLATLPTTPAYTTAASDTTAMQAVTNSVTIAEHSTLSPTTIPLCAESSQSIVIRCSRGNLTISDTDFDLSEALKAEMFSDDTLKCRLILRDMHRWLLRQPHTATGHESADVIHAKCGPQTGLTISDSEPELTEAVRLVYSTGVNMSCRTVFVGFLKTLTKYT